MPGVENPVVVLGALSPTSVFGLHHTGKLFLEIIQVLAIVLWR